MTSVNLDPEYLYEIVRQRVNWGTPLTPVRKIETNLDRFNTATQQVFMLNGTDLKSGDLPLCKDDPITEETQFRNLNPDPKIKVIYIKIANPCLVQGMDGTTSVRMEMDVTEFDKTLDELVGVNGQEKDVLNKLAEGKTQKKLYEKVNVGKPTLSNEKRDIFQSVYSDLIQTYGKSSIKDGELKQQIIGEMAIVSSENKKYVKIFDMTKTVQNPKLCDEKDSETINQLLITEFNIYRNVDEKNMCLDLESTKYYQQNYISSLAAANGVAIKKVQTNPKSQDKKEIQTPVIDNKTKISIIDSYVINYLNTFYNDFERYRVEWMRENDAILLMKITDILNNNVVFHKFDTTKVKDVNTPNVISARRNFKPLPVQEATCPKYGLEPKLKEYVQVQEFCKNGGTLKLKYSVVGSDNSNVVGLNIPKAKLEEVKSLEELEKFKKNFGNFEIVKAFYKSSNPYQNVSSNVTSVSPKEKMDEFDRFHIVERIDVKKYLDF